MGRLLEWGRFLEWGRSLTKTNSKGGAYSEGGAYWKEGAKSNHYISFAVNYQFPLSRICLSPGDILLAGNLDISHSLRPSGLI